MENLKERLGKMTISLLHIVVPTLLVLAILILYINASKKQLQKEIRELKTQLEKLENIPETAVKVEDTVEEITENEPAVQIAVETDKKEEKDEPADTISEAGASEYNTGKSGKTYTKEELESLIKE